MNLQTRHKLESAFSSFKLGQIDKADQLAAELLAIYPELGDALHLRGVIAGLQGRHQEAEAMLKRVVAQGVDNHFVFFNLAKSLTDQGKDSEALEWHRKALGLNPVSEHAWLNFANSLFRLGDIEATVSALRHATKINAALIEAHLLLANCLKIKARWQEALETYELILRLDPSLPYVWARRGALLNDLNRPQDALLSCQRSIQINPEHHEAWSVRGLALSSLGRHLEALESYERASLLDPSSFIAHFNRGLTLRVLGRYQEAIEAFDRSLELRPTSAQAWTMRGLILQELERPSEALACFDTALDHDPEYPEAWNNRGVLLQSLGDHEEAINSYTQATELSPSYIDALKNLALLLQSKKMFYEAVNVYERMIEFKQEDAEIWGNRGVALMSINRHQQALESLEKAICLKDDYAVAYYNRGLALRHLGRYPEALSSCDRAIEIKPDYADAWLNKGVVLQEMERHSDAFNAYEKALSIDPLSYMTYTNRAVLQTSLRRDKEARASFESALTIKADYPDAHWNKALAELRLGNFDVGWPLYEWRWQSTTLGMSRPSFAKPLWLGKEGIRDKVLFVWSEQGFGDAIQFCRLCKGLAELGARVFLEVDPALKALFESLEGVYQLVEKGAAPPDHDFQCPILSLPLALGIKVSSIPADIPYLQPDPGKKTIWNQRLSFVKGKPTVGIVWAGNPEHKNDRNRSIAFAEFKRLLTENFLWVNLQKKITDEDAADLRSLEVLDYSEDLKDFSDTAALISCLDLVICVDTSVAHLAGAIGTPVWLLLPNVPDFRWMWDRSDSPWYPTMRIFRQTRPRDWAEVIQKVQHELPLMRHH